MDLVKKHYAANIYRENFSHSVKFIGVKGPQGRAVWFALWRVVGEILWEGD